MADRPRLCSRSTARRPIPTTSVSRMIRRNRTSPASTCTQWATRSAIWTNTRHWSATRTIRGGFIWDFIDQAIYATQPAGRYTRCVDNVIEQVDEDTLKAVYTYELATPRTRSVAGTYPANTNTPNVPPSAGFHVSVWPVARFRIETSRKPPCLAVAPSNSIW